MLSQFLRLTSAGLLIDASLVAGVVAAVSEARSPPCQDGTRWLLVGRTWVNGCGALTPLTEVVERPGVVKLGRGECAGVFDCDCDCCCWMRRVRRLV